MSVPSGRDRPRGEPSETLPRAPPGLSHRGKCYFTTIKHRNSCKNPEQTARGTVLRAGGAGPVPLLSPRPGGEARRRLLSPLSPRPHSDTGRAGGLWACRVPERENWTQLRSRQGPETGGPATPMGTVTTGPRWRSRPVLTPAELPAEGGDEDGLPEPHVTSPAQHSSHQGPCGNARLSSTGLRGPPVGASPWSPLTAGVSSP